ncbi:hypothetical protein U0070_021057, partial [Myodes glareolus]
GDSLGKGKMLMGRSDAKLLVFLNNLTSPQIMEEQFPGIILKLSSSELQQEVEFDVLLTYDILGDVNIYNKPDPQVYRRLISECTSLGKDGEFSTSFTELQSNFPKDHPPKLKNLIHLIKHWNQQLNLHEQVPTQQLTTLFFSLPFSSQYKVKLGEPLPPQYALELLTVYAWEHGNGVTDFNTAQGFWTVLELITKYKQLQ